MFLCGQVSSGWADLPTEIISKIASGQDVLKAMRLACSSWKTGFDESVVGLKYKTKKQDWVYTNPIRPFQPIDAVFILPPIAERYPLATNFALFAHWQVDLTGLQGSNLKVVDLNGCSNLTPAMLSGLAGVPALGSLDLSNSSVTDAGLNTLLGLPLTTLNLISCRSISAEGLAAFHGMPLAKLNLNFCDLGESGFSALADLPLTKLGLCLCKKGVTDVVLLALRELTRLRDLDLDGSLAVSVTPEGLGCLGKLPLTHLNLGCSNRVDFSFGDRHLEALRGLPLTKLELDFRGGITDGGLLALEGMLLTQLDLTYCTSVTGEVFRSLREMPLARLFLSYCEGMTQAGFQALETLPLSELRLAGCRQVGEEALLCINDFTFLKSIDLKYTGVSRLGVKMLENKGIEVRI